MDELALPVRTIRVDRERDENWGDALVHREWLVTNGLAGYSSGTIAGVATRRYHGLLVAALASPWGRTMMLSQMSELVRLPGGQSVLIAGVHRQGQSPELPGLERLEEFRLEHGLPVWRFQIDDHVLERRLLLVHQQNTAVIEYRLLAGPGPVRLKLRPSVHFRPHDAPVDVPLAGEYVLSARNERLELDNGTGLPPLRLRLHGAHTAFTFERQVLPRMRFAIEETRGDTATGETWSPGYFRCTVDAGSPAILLASTEGWEDIDAFDAFDAWQIEQSRRENLLAAAPPAARAAPLSELVLAADTFLVTPVVRPDERIAARARGEEERTLVAGYHWFTDWGRDSMISLEGLTLRTGRTSEARRILMRFAEHARDGLIPNFFSEREGAGLYHTADASMWFFHALDRFLEIAGDERVLHRLHPVLEQIVAAHFAGTRFGIRVADDGLLTQGAPGYQLTWMDAKVADWVVTPRRGKAVEINGLWHNALMLLADWRERIGAGGAGELRERAAAHRDAFNRRFWSDRLGYLYDVVDGEDGDDPALRPNQLLAISPRYPVLARERWAPVVAKVKEHLLTPVGLRTLSRDHASYRSQYFGDLRARDAAYHQGTVWPWLIGPFIDAWLRVHPDDRAGAARFLERLLDHLDEACVGSISEIFDGDPPHAPRGCIAQAWSVAEVLRCALLVGGGAAVPRETRRTRGMEVAPSGRARGRGPEE